MSSLTRIGALATALILASTAASIAAGITILPSDNLTLQTRVRGMGGNPEKEGANIVVTSHGSPELRITANTCHALTDVTGFHTSSSSSSGTGRPAEQTHTVKFRLSAKTQPGECAITFTAGPAAQELRVRIVKP